MRISDWSSDVCSSDLFAYMDATREYIEAHGKPVAFYSDKHSVFRNNTASAKGDGMTHFGRALEALAIEIICAHSPQAKGRVRSEEHTSELQSLMRISYAVFCLKKKKIQEKAKLIPT